MKDVYHITRPIRNATQLRVLLGVSEEASDALRTTYLTLEYELRQFISIDPM